MKNTEKRKKSGIIRSLIGLLLIAASVSAVSVFYKSEKNAGVEEIASYYKFDIVHSYELRTEFLNVLRTKKGGGLENGNVYAQVSEDGEVLGESVSGAYDTLKESDGVVFVFRKDKAAVIVDGKKKEEIPLDFIGEYGTLKKAYNGKIESVYMRFIFPFGDAAVYAAPLNAELKTTFYLHAATVYGITAASLAGIVLLITSLFAKGKREAYDIITEKVARPVFFEIKWAVFAAVSLTLIWLIYDYFQKKFELPAALFAAALLWYAVFSLRIFITDIKRRGVAGYFKNTFLIWLIGYFGKVLGKKQPYRKITVFSIVYAALCTVSFVIIAAAGRTGPALIGAFVFATSTAGYLINAIPLINDLDKFTDKLYTLSETGSTGGISLPGSSGARPLDLALDNVELACRTSAEKAFEEEKTRVELITNVSHDLKTPLTSIISYTELLSGTEGLGEEAREYVNILAVKENRLKKLIEDLFDLSKASVTIHKDGLQTIDFTTLVKQQLSYNSDTIDASGLVFDVTLPETELTVKADGAKLHNVIENLINNAIKYSLSGSRVYVTLSEENKTARFEIKNISRDKLNVDPAKLTERFVRGDESRTEEGSGLGLAIAKTYTELCGGRFDLSVDGDLFKVALSFDTVVTAE